MGLGEGIRRLKSSGIGLGPPIAVDFGTHSLKLLQIAPGESGSLIAAACLPTPEGFVGDPVARFEFQAEALGRLVRSGGFRGRRAVCAIPATQTLCKLLRIQKTEGASVETLVGVALGAQLGCDPSAVVFRHIEVSDNTRQSGKTDVICLAAGRERVERLMRALKNARLEPVGIHNEFAAVLAGVTRVDESDVPTLILDMGYGSTKVIIAHGSKMVFAKTIETGGRHMDEHLASLLKIGLAEAVDVRRAMTGIASNLASADSSATDGGGGVATKARPRRVVGPKPDLTEVMEVLTDEIQMCLRYHDSAFPGTRVSRVVFVGGEARQRHLGEHVARVLRLPARAVDPLARIVRTGKEPSIGVDFSEAQPGWALPLGLCVSRTDL